MQMDAATAIPGSKTCRKPAHSFWQYSAVALAGGNDRYSDPPDVIRTCMIKKLELALPQQERWLWSGSRVALDSPTAAISGYYSCCHPSDRANPIPLSKQLIYQELQIA